MFVFLFSCLAASALAVSISENPLDVQSYFLYEESPGVYANESLIIKPDYDAKISDLEIYFYSRNIEEVKVNISNLSTLSKTDFSKEKQTVFCVHGWKNDYNSSVNVDIRTAYCQARDVNVFIVDWSKVANGLYVIAQSNVYCIGRFLGQFIKNLVRDAGLNLGNTVLVGHSLGAHVVGVAGKYIGGAADHIVGMDPAGPLFVMSNTKNRISRKSAKYVQIIHTDAGGLGMNNRLGNADYWPNGGKRQPGCGFDIAGICAHSRSYIYFSESLMDGNFTARACKDWRTYKKGQCAGNRTSYLGGVAVDKKASGNYFLKTNGKFPYAKS